jgi:hypothetical protein
MKIANLGLSSLLFDFVGHQIVVKSRSTSVNFVCDKVRLAKITSVENFVNLLRFELDPSERVLLDVTSIPAQVILSPTEFKALEAKLAEDKITDPDGSKAKAKIEADKAQSEQLANAELVPAGQVAPVVPTTNIAPNLDSDDSGLTEAQKADLSQAGIVKELGADVASAPDSTATAVVENGEIKETTTTQSVEKVDVIAPTADAPSTEAVATGETKGEGTGEAPATQSEGSSDTASEPAQSTEVKEEVKEEVAAPAVAKPASAPAPAKKK